MLNLFFPLQVKESKTSLSSWMKLFDKLLW